MDYDYVRGNLLSHADHNFEGWSAYLSSDDGMPFWVNGNDSGICCHTCRVIAIDS